MVGFCLFEVKRHSPFGRGRKIAMKNQQDFAHICFFYKFFQRLFFLLKMTQKGQGLRLFFTEQTYLMNICVNLFHNILSQEHLVPSKFRYKVRVKMRKGEPWKNNHCCDKLPDGKAPIQSHGVSTSLNQQGGTRHRLVYVTNLPIHIKLDCVYYKIICD